MIKDILSENEFKNIIEENNLTLIKKKLLDNKNLIIICGPTCCGKTEVALNLALLFGTNIISADSMQAYKYMDIGTDKQNLERYHIKQYMVDVCDPNHNMTAVEFRDIARKVMQKDFFEKNKIPIIVGGSGLHIRAIIDDLMYAPDADAKIRKEIKQGIKEKGLKNFYEKLKSIDEHYASKISENDERRIIRALEVYQTTGKKYSDFLTNWDKRKSIYNSIFIGLNPDKKKLYDNIDKRVNKMIEDGLLIEVKYLIINGFSKSNSIKQAIGYKELLKYFDKEITLEEAIEEIKKNTKHLAKKQITWFKADDRINWIAVSEHDNIKSLLYEIINIVDMNLKVGHEKN